MPGAKPGQRFGGRAPNTPNRQTVEAIARLDELGYDPIAEMVKIARSKKSTPDMKARMAIELGGYKYSKRKAIELTRGDGDRGDFTLTELLLALRGAAR